MSERYISEVDLGHEGEGVRYLELPLEESDAYSRWLESLGPEESIAYEDKLRRLSELYGGSGGQ
jgi:hypothetical protein